MGVDCARAAVVGTILFLLLGCQSGSEPGGVSPTAGIGEDRLIELDLFTVYFNYHRAKSDTNVQLTESGRKYLRQDPPGIQYLPENASVYVPAAVKPTVWDAYVCFETWLGETSSPDSVGLMYFQNSTESGEMGKKFVYLPGGRRDVECNPITLFYKIREMDGGFLLVVGNQPVLGSIRIYYR